MAGRELGEWFSPVEFPRLGVEVTWCQELVDLVERDSEMGDK